MKLSLFTLIAAVSLLSINAFGEAPIYTCGPLKDAAGATVSTVGPRINAYCYHLSQDLYIFDGTNWFKLTRSAWNQPNYSQSLEGIVATDFCAVTNEVAPRFSKKGRIVFQNGTHVDCELAGYDNSRN